MDIEEETYVPNYICVTCGVQYAAERPPEHCPICEDERQYVNLKGQTWTTLDAIRGGHRNIVQAIDPGITAFRTDPQFAIGQQAYLIQTAGGNILWDCISFIDDATIRAVRALGGISAIAISHPHFYSAMVEWSHAFDNAPIYLHESNRAYVMRPDPAIVYWEGETCALGDDVRVVRCGGHFEGSSVLHWTGGAEGRGALFTGDTINVVPDVRYVSFMYSFPNLIPLSPSAVRRIVQSVQPFAFDRIYGGWSDRIVKRDAQAAVTRSAERYIRAIQP